MPFCSINKICLFDIYIVNFRWLEAFFVYLKFKLVTTSKWLQSQNNAYAEIHYFFIINIDDRAQKNY